MYAASFPHVKEPFAKCWPTGDREPMRTVQLGENGNYISGTPDEFRALAKACLDAAEWTDAAVESARKHEEEPF